MTPFGRVLRLNTIYWGNLIPSAMQASITVNRVFFAPLVRMVTVDMPFFSIVLSAGKSKVNGVWSALTMSESGIRIFSDAL